MVALAQDELELVLPELTFYNIKPNQVDRLQGPELSIVPWTTRLLRPGPHLVNFV